MRESMCRRDVPHCKELALVACPVVHHKVKYEYIVLLCPNNADARGTFTHYVASAYAKSCYVFSNSPSRCRRRAVFVAEALVRIARNVRVASRAPSGDGQGILMQCSRKHCRVYLGAHLSALIGRLGWADISECFAQLVLNNLPAVMHRVAVSRRTCFFVHEEVPPSG